MATGFIKWILKKCNRDAVVKSRLLLQSDCDERGPYLLTNKLFPQMSGLVFGWQFYIFEILECVSVE